MKGIRFESQSRKENSSPTPGKTGAKTLQKSGSFFPDVYQIVRQIPYGRVTSYGAIAAFLGIRGSARMVGWAMNASHTQLADVPAHRVVNRNGLLTGKHHFGGPDVMKELLENEGVSITNDRIDRFQELFWDPAEHLK